MARRAFSWHIVNVKMNPSLVTCAALAFLGHRAQCQAFNIDVGSADSQLPTSAYGAASGQAGLWTRAANDAVSLVDTSGHVTAAQFFASGGPLTLGGISSSNADESTFMSSAKRMEGNGFNFAQAIGLLSGWYDVFVYCWSGPQFSQPTINIVTDLSSYWFTPNSFALWPGQQVEGITFVKARVFTQGGGLAISYSLPANSYAALNGLQIVPVPAPGAAAVCLASAAAIILRRRHR